METAYNENENYSLHADSAIIESNLENFVNGVFFNADSINRIVLG